MIFTIGDIVILLVVFAMLVVYRQVDRNNRSLEKVRRYSDKVSQDLEEIVDSKTVELRNLAIDLDVHQKSAREALKRITGIQEEIRNRTEGADEIERRLNDYDTALKDLIEMTRAVDDNLQRLHRESEFVDAVGKQLKESMHTMALIEKSLPALRQDFSRKNAEQLNAVSAEVLKSVEARIDSMTDQVARSEAMVSDFSAHIARLESRRDEMEEDTVASLRTRFQAFVDQAEESREAMKRRFAEDIEALLDEHEVGARELLDSVGKERQRLKEEVTETQELLNERLEAFQDRMDSIEEEYQRSLQDAAERGRALEADVFGRLKEHIESRARAVEDSLSGSLAETKERLEASRNELVKMFGETRSEITVWRAELRTGANEAIEEMRTRFGEFSEEMEKRLSATLSETSGTQDEQRRRLEDYMSATTAEIESLEDRISAAVSGLDRTILDKEREFQQNIEQAVRRGEEVATAARVEIERRIAGFKDQLLSRFSSLEATVGEYEDGLDYRVRRIEGVYGEIESLEEKLRTHMDSVARRVRRDFEEVLAEVSEERDEEKRRAEEQLAAVRASMETIDRELTELKTRAYENVSEKLQVFEDDFFSGLKERGGRLEERIEEWQREITGRLDELSTQHNRERDELERAYRDELGAKLTELQEETTHRYDRFDTQVAGFESRIQERISETEESMGRFEVTIQEELGSLRTRTAEELENEMSGFAAAIRERVATQERDLKAALRELSESFESGKIELTSGLESARSEMAVWQAKVLQQMREAETSVAGEVETLRTETHATVERLKETYRTERDELVAASETERRELREELQAVHERISELRAELDERSTESMTEMEHRARQFLQELSEKSRAVQNEVDDRIRDFRTQVQDMRDKIDASQQKLYGSIEENYKILSVNIQEIEKKQKAFIDQTKLFERADTLKIDLTESIAALKGDLSRTEEQSRELRSAEREFARIKKLGEEVSAKLGKFFSEKRRIDALEHDFKRLMSLSQSVDAKLDQVTSSHDTLQEIQATIRDLELLEEEASQRFDRLEKRKQIIDSTTAGVDKNFEALQELERAVQTIEQELVPLPEQVSRLEARLIALAQDKPRADQAIEALERLESTLTEIEERIERMQTAREWLAGTETRLTEINNQAAEQLELMRSLMKEEPGRKAKRTDGAPSLDKRNMVTRLAHQGWKIDQIVKATELSRGEVELILELQPKR